MNEAMIGKTYRLDGGYFLVASIETKDKGPSDDRTGSAIAVGPFVPADGRTYTRGPYVDQLRVEASYVPEDVRAKLEEELNR